MNDDGKDRENGKPGVGGLRTPLQGESSSSNIPASDIFSADTMAGFTPSTIGADSWAGTSRVEGELEPGTVIGNRYEIIQMLGAGGMGAVYKTRDIEIGRFVAFKVIRPEFARDRNIIERFKQELLLASQVTHKNVVRIFDLGEAEGMKFITMEYVDGRDLHLMFLEHGSFSPQESIGFIRQVCRALEAAHAVGVVHRDLKPQNILVEATGRVLVMDFGLARSIEDSELTQSGSLVGTMDYMSPEQALGKQVDQRSDIFALGIIFYQLLSGKMPFQAHSAVASLVLRTQQDVVPCSTLCPDVPKPLCDIVSRCLQRDLDLRYQHVNEIVADLDAFEGGAPVTHIYPSIVAANAAANRKMMLRWGSIAAIVLIVGSLGVAFRSNIVRLLGGGTPATQAGPVVSLAVFPLRNASGDPSLDWMSVSLAEMLTSAVGQSAHLHTVSAENLRQIYSDLRLTPESTIDPSMLQRIAGFTTADKVVAGQYIRLGSQINIQVELHDLKTGQSTELKAQAEEKDLPTAIASIAESLRKDLSLSSTDIKTARAQSFQVTSTSLAALRDYNQALAFTRVGQNLEANKLLPTVVAADPQFALAFALLSHVQAELGYESEAVQSSRRAVELSDSQNLPAVVKDMIHANHYRVSQDNKKAIDAYEVLYRNLPGDADIRYALASLYIETSVYDKARTLVEQMLKDDPKDIRALWQMGVLEITSNNPQGALEPLNQALSLTIQTNNVEMKALIELAIGISYRLLGKPDDAMRNYQDSVAVNEKIGQKRGVAAALAEMAIVQANSGDQNAALASYKRALQLLREIGMDKEVGDTLNDMGYLLSDMGQTDQALQAYQEALKTQRESGDENWESQCLTNIANVYVARGDTGNALTYFQQALQLREKLAVPGYLAETLFGMGKAYTLDGQYDEATKVLVRAIDLARKADEQQEVALISHQMGVVFAARGRYGAAINSMQDALKGLRALNDKSKDLVEVQNDLALALAEAGRENDAEAALEGADSLAHDLKSSILLAKLFNTRGDIALYRGDPSGAAKQYQQALQAATAGKDASVIAASRYNVARAAIAQGHARETVSVLTSLDEKQDTVATLLAVRISTALAEALIDTQALPRARQTLLSALEESEKAGMNPETARIYYLLSIIAKSSNNTGDAVSYSRQALKALNAIQTEPGGNSVLQRADLKEIYKTCTETAAAH